MFLTILIIFIISFLLAIRSLILLTRVDESKKVKEVLKKGKVIFYKK